jgi:hypothetical protein
MKLYWVEGLFITAAALKKARKSGRAPSEVEPFAKSFWAADPPEALRLATEALQGGQWADAPKVTQTSEEQRMRSLGAPTLPGFDTPPARAQRK